MDTNEMLESILFAIDELGKARLELGKLPSQYTDRARWWLEAAMKTLEQAAAVELAALVEGGGR